MIDPLIIFIYYTYNRYCHNIVYIIQNTVIIFISILLSTSFNNYNIYFAVIFDICNRFLLPKNITHQHHNIIIYL